MSKHGKSEIKSLLQSVKKEELGRGLLICMGMLSNHPASIQFVPSIAEAIPINLIEPSLHHKDRDIWGIATWAWTNARRRVKTPTRVSVATLNALFGRWQEGVDDRAADLADYAMSCQIGIDRDFWKPKLTAMQMQQVRERFDSPSTSEPWNERHEKIACFFIAYHAKSVGTDEEMASRIASVERLAPKQQGGPKWDVIRTALGVKTTAKKNSTKG